MGPSKRAAALCKETKWKQSGIFRSTVPFMTHLQMTVSLSPRFPLVGSCPSPLSHVLFYSTCTDSGICKNKCWMNERMDEYYSPVHQEHPPLNLTWPYQHLNAEEEEWINSEAQAVKGELIWFTALRAKEQDHVILIQKKTYKHHT